MPATKVKSRWTSGNLEFLDSAGNVIATFDGTAGVLRQRVGQVYQQRFRVTTAAVNAGATLLAALAGRQYRLIDCAALAVGGAAAAVTTVDILGTVSTARKLVAFGQAALTQSALVRAGSSGGVLLADGASFTANDANTAITIGVTGSAMTTATHIDVLLTYAID